jgi:phosphatidylglycerophosphate synthase
MNSNLLNIPNALTALRLISVPILWAFALLRLPQYIGVGLIFAGLTDALDGYAARKLSQTSDFGSKFDSIADQFLQLSAVVWIFMLMPEIFSENQFLSITALGIYILSLTVGLIKFKRIANLHLYLSKFGGVFLFLFIVHSLISGQYNKSLFVLASVGFVVSSTETLVLQLILPKVNEHMGSIFFLFLADDHPIQRLRPRIP